MKLSSRGFTLIELLVVIAIIGLLSSVVLASLALARLKGADGNIKGNLHTIQTQMELYYANQTPNSYGPTAFTVQSSPVSVVPTVGNYAFIQDATINSALKSAIATGGAACWAIGPSGNSYAVSVQLKTDTTKWWCVDSSGTPKLSSASCGGALGGGTNPAACN